MVHQLSPILPDGGTTLPACCHHWVIQPAIGPVSQGECRNCGEIREFKNYVEASSWGDEKAPDRALSPAGALASQFDDEPSEE